MPKIPFLDLPGLHRPLAAALHQSFEQAVSNAAFIGGKAVTEFETAFASYCGAKHCAGVANGTDALMLALRALGIGKGDVVVIPAHTFIATSEAADMLGAIPRFVDIDPNTYTMSPEALEKVDPKGVKAVLPVHLYGQPADMDPIAAIANKRGWKLVEDSAQAHGATYKGKPIGSWGQLTGFSFYPGKNLGAIGDGGAVISNDDELIAKVRQVANHGRAVKFDHAVSGVNSRLDSIQASALAIKLPHLNDWNAGRARAAAWYDARFEGVKGMVAPKKAADRTHVYHLYVVQVPERERLMDSLSKADIGSGVHYGKALHLQPAYAHLGYEKGAFPVAEQVTENCLSLPMYPGLSEEQVDAVSKVVIEHVKAGS